MGGAMMILVLAGDTYLPPPGIPLFSILYFGFKWLIWMIRVDIWTVALMIVSILSIPYIIAVKIPMLSGKKMLDLLHRSENAVENIVKNYKTYGVPFLGIFTFMFWAFELSITEMTSVGGLIRNSLFSFLVIFLVSFAKSDSGRTNNGNQQRQQRQSNQQGVYNNIQNNNQNQMSLLPEPLISTATSFKNALLMQNSPSGQTYNKAKGKAVKSAKKSKVSNPKIVIFLLLGAVFMVVQWTLLVGVFGFYASAILPSLASAFYGPILTVLGVGTDYGFLADQTIIDSIAPNIDFEEEKLLLQEVGARASCLFSVNSVGCMSEWRMNNTVQPGSEEVGQEYKLEVDSFIVEGGRTLDVSGYRADLPLAIRMSLSNPRYGLKGVPARNVSYKVGITDGDREGYYCDTGNHDIFDHQDRGRDESDLAPGDVYQLTSVQRSKEFYQNNINLASCGLLQPGQVEETRQAELQVNYTYTSQATQSFQAMSEEHRLENDIQPSFKTSETADTPVKSFVTVLSPVTYREGDYGDTYSNVIDVEIGFETDKPGIEYQINTDEVRFTPSRLTVPTNTTPSNDEITTVNDIESIRGGQCDFELTENSKDGDAYKLKLNEEAKESIESQQNRGQWWTARSSPPTFQCAFELLNPESISATGETLIKDVEGTYRVSTSYTSQNFEVWNTDCRTRNCPLIVPKDQKQKIDSSGIKKGLVSKCSRSVSAEAASGCDVRPVPLDGGDFTPKDWRVISSDHPEVNQGETIEYSTIRTGKTAYTYGGLKNDFNEIIGSEHKTVEKSSDSDTPEDWQAVGINQELKEETESFIADKSGGAALVRVGDRIQLKQVNYMKCSNMEGSSFTDEEFENKLEEKLYGEPIFYTYANKGNCDDEWESFLTEKFGEGFSVSAEQAHKCTVGAIQDGFHNSVTLFTGGLGVAYSTISDRPLFKNRCAKSVVTSIAKATSSSEDFGSEDSVWMYNIEEQLLEPVG